MNYNEFIDELLALEKAKIEYIKSQKRRGSYFNIFQISIDIINKLIELGNQIRKLKKT